jgi:hypothetical protein
MRVFLMVVFFAGGAARLWLDWQATLAQGYAFRFTSIGRAIAEAFPEVFFAVADALKGGPFRVLWDPVATTLLAAPFALVLLVLAGLLWVTRARARVRG